MVVPDDLKRMYLKYPHGGSVTLWCDARCQEDDVDNAHKKKRDTDTSRKQNIDENERDVDQAYKKLLDKHI